MTEFEMIANEMTALAAEDFVEGYRNCARQYGSAFLADGWAVKLPDPEDRAIDVSRYAIASTGKKLPRNMCLYFDARDYFLGTMFSGIYNLSGEAFVQRLSEKAKHAVRERGRFSKKKLVCDVLTAASNDAAVA